MYELSTRVHMEINTCAQNFISPVLIITCMVNAQILVVKINLTNLRFNFKTEKLKCQKIKYRRIIGNPGIHCWNLWLCFPYLARFSLIYCINLSTVDSITRSYPTLLISFIDVLCVSFYLLCFGDLIIEIDVFYSGKEVIQLMFVTIWVSYKLKVIHYYKLFNV